MSAVATKHSIDRAKERRKLKNHKAAERNIEKALVDGKRAGDYSSWERNFLLHEGRDGCLALAYNNFCYIFNDQDICVTLYPLPAWFGKKKRFEGKDRVRDYKRYYTNYLDDLDEVYERSGTAQGITEENGITEAIQNVDSSFELYCDMAIGRTKGAFFVSRDWTPREMYLVEQAGIREGRGDYWDFLAGLEWVLPGKEPVRLHSDEEIALRQQFPVLGKFLDPFMKLYKRISKYEHGVEFLKMEDLCLQEYITTGNHSPGSYLVRWFEGELDERFYYREHNDELLMDCLCEEAMVHAGKQYEVYMEYRLDRYAAHGIGEAELSQFKAEYLEDVQEGRFKGTLHQYEMEVGYGHVGSYDSFDKFLDTYCSEKVGSVDALIERANIQAKTSGSQEPYMEQKFER